LFLRKTVTLTVESLQISRLHNSENQDLNFIIMKTSNIASVQI